MDAALRQRLGDALGAAVRAAQPVAGGDINDAWSVGLEDGRRVFAKSRSDAPARLFTSEAGGLAWLGEAGALRVPRVLAVDDARPAFLALEWLEPGPRCADFDERLGRGLAALHRSGAESFGLADDNFIGTVPQRNRPHDRWCDFYRCERLEPMFKRVVDAGHLSTAARRGADRLLADLGALTGPDEPPARLHGDLWAGNLHVDATGHPVLIDPSVYAGHREIDLAMLRLFGGASARVFDAYDELHPLSPGADERVPLYWLYPLLVHLHLFGASYSGQVESAIRACAT